MTSAELVDRLAEHGTLGSAPRRELEWLVSHGSLRQLEAGAVVSAKGVRIDDLYVVLSGALAHFVDRGTGRTKVMEWREGEVTGLLPYSRLVAPPGESIALEATTVLSVSGVHLREMTRECHEITTILVHKMLDRARIFKEEDVQQLLQQEKMASLGRLSAGLAHELNNPASAIERSVARLGDEIQEVEQATRALDRSRLTDEQLAAVDVLRTSCVGAGAPGVRSPIEEARREETIAGWLGGHGLDAANADALAQTPVTLEALDRVAAAVGESALNAVLRWAAAECSVRNLASEIQDAATRISGLVIAIKDYTRMDRAIVAEPVDLNQGLGSTVTVLRAKARGKSAAVVVDTEPGLPPVRGYAGELNQIWSNLIENALDAIPESGRVEVQAKGENGRVVVRIVDNGPGIPDGIRDRIFEPFFTTKPFGQGTGLGLDIVRRLVLHNDGDISFESRPGRTEFRVVLRAADRVADRATS
jgi:signal transduction histidine kinase